MVCLVKSIQLWTIKLPSPAWKGTECTPHREKLIFKKAFFPAISFFLPSNKSLYSWLLNYPSYLKMLCLGPKCLNKPSIPRKHRCLQWWGQHVSLSGIAKARLVIRSQEALLPPPPGPPTSSFLGAQGTEQVEPNLASQDWWEASHPGPVCICIFLLKTPEYRLVRQCLVYYPASQPQNLEKNPEAQFLLWVQQKQWISHWGPKFSTGS